MQQQPNQVQPDPGQVPITITLNLAQVNLVLDGLGNLPFARVEQLYNGIRALALQTLQAAEQAYKDSVAKAEEVARKPEGSE